MAYRRKTYLHSYNFVEVLEHGLVESGALFGDDFLGHSIIAYNCLQMNFWAATTVIFVTGSVSTHLVKYSKAAMAKWMLLLARGGGLMMSIPQHAKGHTGGSGCSSAGGVLMFCPIN